MFTKTKCDLIDNFKLIILHILFTFGGITTQCLTYGYFNDTEERKKENSNQIKPNYDPDVDLLKNDKSVRLSESNSK